MSYYILKVIFTLIFLEFFTHFAFEIHSNFFLVLNAMKNRIAFNTYKIKKYSSDFATTFTTNNFSVDTFKIKVILPFKINMFYIKFLEKESKLSWFTIILLMFKIQAKNNIFSKGVYLYKYIKKHIY